MKNTTILLLFLCCMYPVNMQAQTEFSQTGTQWKTNYFSYGGWRDKYVDVDCFYELGGDTLLGDKNCKKLYMNEALIGAFLEEDRKVWYYPFQEYTNDPERLLLYDFSKEKGDKIESYVIPWNTGGNLSNLGFPGNIVTLTVENVHFESGRKVMEISSNYSNGDIWIEGIGSTVGFWGADLAIPTDGSNTSTSLVQVLASDKSALYHSGQVVDPNYKSTFLKVGKTWEIQTPLNSIDKFTIGEPQIINNYPSYPVYKNGYHYDGGYLYDVNGVIYWTFNSQNGLTLAYDYSLYNFNHSIGKQVYLCTRLYRTEVYYAPSGYSPYKVIQADMIQCMGKSLKRVVLEGDIKHVWLEDVGSLNLLLYLDNSGYYLDAPQYKLLRCYTGDEMIYDYSDFPDGIEEAVLSAPTYSIIDNQLIVKDGDGYRLSLYDPSGVEVYNQALSDMEESIPLPVHPATILIGRLQKGDIVVSFKIGEAGK